MHRTIFTTPVVNTLLRALSLGTLKMLGWQVQGSLPANTRLKPNITTKASAE